MSKTRDEKYMDIALKEARRTMQEGNLPIGAVLVINDEIIGIRGNNQVINSDFSSHAESLLIREHSSRIKEVSKEGGKLELFSTLEPCLMCFGTAVHNRINRIIYACPDPLAGVTSMQAPTEWYQRRWPEIVSGVHRDVSYDLFVGYIGEHLDIWENAVKQFEDMRKSW